MLPICARRVRQGLSEKALAPLPTITALSTLSGWAGRCWDSGSWTCGSVLGYMAAQPGLNPRRLAVVGLGQAGVIAIVASALLGDTISSAAALDVPVSYITRTAYANGTRMGLLATGDLARATFRTWPRCLRRRSCSWREAPRRRA